MTVSNDQSVCMLGLSIAFKQKSKYGKHENNLAYCLFCALVRFYFEFGNIIEFEGRLLVISLNLLEHH